MPGLNPGPRPIGDVDAGDAGYVTTVDLLVDSAIAGPVGARTLESVGHGRCLGGTRHPSNEENGAQPESSSGLGGEVHLRTFRRACRRGTDHLGTD